MHIFNSVSETRKQINGWKQSGKTIGFVPTMGYLHKGHMSIIEKAKEENDKVVVSIFVNPTQFGPNEDLEKYPRDFQKDRAICEDLGVDIIFAPEVTEMYPEKGLTTVSVNTITTGLCGASREGHFNGVCTVVTKLFNITMPDKAYFGEKDAQQLATIIRMTKDLNLPIEIVPCETYREEDGLALSSRNVYLSNGERISARVLRRTLLIAKNMIEKGERKSEKIIDIVKNTIINESIGKIDYVEFVDANTLQAKKDTDGTNLLALAAFFGKTRLIDNIRITK